MDCTMIGYTVDSYEELSVENATLIEKLEAFSGKLCGICYMKDGYFGTNVSDPDKAYKRYHKVVPTGHTSFADHVHITLLFEGIPKMMAMILNSLGFYTTSEKSARYTIMSASGKNKELYDKWLEIFKDRIDKEYPDMDKFDDKLRTKLAQENARYMLSVFEPCVTMGYTTSLRQFAYIKEWCMDYVLTCKRETAFDDLVCDCIRKLHDLIPDEIISYVLVDNKDRSFDFLANQVRFNIYDATESYDDAYLIKYKASFADLAQEQRHRTIRYYMCYDGDKFDWYVPKIIAYNAELTAMWKRDLDSIKDTYPVATKVDIVETGLIQYFMLKCDERLCGRVQFETMDTITQNLLKFARSRTKSPFTISQLERHIKDGKLIMKCGNITCKEPCYFGPLKAQTRLV